METSCVIVGVEMYIRSNDLFLTYHVVTYDLVFYSSSEGQYGVDAFYDKQEVPRTDHNSAQRGI